MRQSEPAFRDAAWEGRLAEVQEHLRQVVNVNAVDKVCVRVNVRVRVRVHVRSCEFVYVCLCACVCQCVRLSLSLVSLSSPSRAGEHIRRTSLSTCPSISRCIYMSMDMCIDASIVPLCIHAICIC